MRVTRTKTCKIKIVTPNSELLNLPHGYKIYRTNLCNLPVYEKYDRFIDLKTITIKKIVGDLKVLIFKK